MYITDLGNPANDVSFDGLIGHDEQMVDIRGVDESDGDQIDIRAKVEDIFHLCSNMRSQICTLQSLVKNQHDQIEQLRREMNAMRLKEGRTEAFVSATAQDTETTDVAGGSGMTAMRSMVSCTQAITSAMAQDTDTTEVAGGSKINALRSKGSHTEAFVSAMTKDAEIIDVAGGSGMSAMTSTVGRTQAINSATTQDIEMTDAVGGSEINAARSTIGPTHAIVSATAKDTETTQVAGRSEINAMRCMVDCTKAIGSGTAEDTEATEGAGRSAIDTRQVSISGEVISLLHELNDNIRGGANSTMMEGDDNVLENQRRLATELRELKHAFSDFSVPKGKFAMDPLKCIPYDPDSKFSTERGIRNPKTDTWWSRLAYEYDLDGVPVKGDVLPLFGSYLDLQTRTSSKLENDGNDVVGVHIPIRLVHTLVRHIGELTGNIVPKEWIEDMKHGLVSFLASVPSELTPLEVVLYQPILDEDGKVVDYRKGNRSPLPRLYKEAENKPEARILRGVAFVHVDATLSCATGKYCKQGNLPRDEAIMMTIKLVGFHCLRMCGTSIKLISKYPKRTTYQ